MSARSDELVRVRKDYQDLAKKFVDMKAFADAQELEVKRLNALINTPHTNNFLEAVRTEAAHQRERWGSDHDAGKTDVDWIFLVGYLGGKAVQCGNSLQDVMKPLSPEGEAGKWYAGVQQKRLHHIITAAAACLNWHMHVSGVDTRMRPGILPPTGASPSRPGDFDEQVQR